MKIKRSKKSTNIKKNANKELFWISKTVGREQKTKRKKNLKTKEKLESEQKKKLWWRQPTIVRYISPN